MNRVVFQKRIGIVIFALILIATCLWLSSRSKDAEISRVIPGTWIADWNEDLIWKMGPQPTNSFSKLFLQGTPEGWSADGTWRVHRGSIILTITNSPSKARTDSALKGYLPVEEWKVIQINEHQLKLLNSIERDKWKTLHRKDVESPAH